MPPCSGGAWALGCLILIVFSINPTNKDTFQKVEIINTTERMVSNIPMEFCSCLLQVTLTRRLQMPTSRCCVNSLQGGLLTIEY